MIDELRDLRMDDAEWMTIIRARILLVWYSSECPGEIEATKWWTYCVFPLKQKSEAPKSL